MPKSTKSFLFPDVNVWIALTYDGHVHHRVATRWFQSLGTNARLFFCRVTQLGLLRLLTTEKVMGEKEVLSQAQAWDAYDRWLQDERVMFLAEPPEIEAAFRVASRSPRPGPKEWADSYLAAFAQTANLTLVTFDRALRLKVGQSLLLTP
ncbi:MAG: TA system VapC family ribonuclease toxin [Terriglobia bacterium]